MISEDIYNLTSHQLKFTVARYGHWLQVFVCLFINKQAKGSHVWSWITSDLLCWFLS